MDPFAANRTLAAIRTMFNWAISRSLLEINPCSHVKPPGQETRRERTLTAAEMQELWPVFAGIGYPFGPYFQIALLTAQRRSEVAGYALGLRRPGGRHMDAGE